MKVIVSSTSSLLKYALMEKMLDDYIKDNKMEELVSGGAHHGADRFSEVWAKLNGIPVKKFIANWKNVRKAAPVRNRKMAKYADALIAFWDGKSPGTRNMIEEATKRKLKVKVIKVEE